MIAAVYARKSTEQLVAVDQKSVARQVEQATAYATRKGWTVDDAHVYIDDGISGAEFAGRPGFVRLMNALKPRPPFGVLIMSEESRLGREAIETAYALKQLITAGVRVFFYLADCERTFESPTDKLLMSVAAFADELERARARQRTYDALSRKARSGHVTGGRTFGYDNVEVLGERDAHGKQHRQRVERRINESEATIVRRIFELASAGSGYARIAKLLNSEHAPCPRPQQGRPAGWSPSTISAIIHRPLYRGVIVWNQTKKRDPWGQRKFLSRPEAEWLIIPAPELRIIGDSLWNTVHARLDGIRTSLQTAAKSPIGRRSRDVESNYLLPGFARCAVCGGGMGVASSSAASGRVFYYTCIAHHKRGSAVCTNNLRVRMDRVDRAVLASIGGEVLRPELVTAVIDGVVSGLRRVSDGPSAADRAVLTRELQKATREADRLTEAIATGGQMATLLQALKARQERTAEIQALLSQNGLPAKLVNRKQIERDVRGRLDDWRGLLTRNVQDGRELLRRVLVGPLRLTPQESGYRFDGEAAIGRLFDGVVSLPTKLASPAGFEPALPA